ncbi:DNA primase large subunit PriL [Methanoplanus limicola]|uniref:DNA primase large subunit PriL n=1 Tax=Methanoplanus limicola DSM 2279 TaxID=937775 RepID=H1YZ29_9EURY|nr:DNA primase large subunit PriL [Methanoplanus limicola]EHQ34258.1 DNA primase large subunit [Methanoplanus limicola DSM 2279]
MPVEFDKKDLAKYPFLKEAHDLVSSSAYSLDNFLKSRTGTEISKHAAERVKKAIKPPYLFENIRNEFPEGEIMAYAISRVIVSCMKERAVIDKICRYESEKAYFYLQTEEKEKRDYISQSMGIDPFSDEIPVHTYVMLVPNLRDAKWQLVNRELNRGMVRITNEEKAELLKERIRTVLHQQLPFPVTDSICELLKTATEEISVNYKQTIFEQFGSLDEGSFPPCMKAIIAAVSEGTNIPHTARFAVTAFMHTIGMDLHQIVEVYTRAPDFDVQKTMYQVEHISGKGGTEYNPPGCATMKTYGLCVNPDAICKNKSVTHPLWYYKQKKKMSAQKKAWNEKRGSLQRKESAGKTKSGNTNKKSKTGQIKPKTENKSNNKNNNY